LPQPNALAQDFCEYAFSFMNFERYDIYHSMSINITLSGGKQYKTLAPLG